MVLFLMSLSVLLTKWLSLHQYRSDDAADDADEGAAEDLAEGMLAEHHAAGHYTARDEDGGAEPPDRVESEDGCVGYQGSDDAAGACRVYADLPP